MKIKVGDKTYLVVNHGTPGAFVMTLGNPDGLTCSYWVVEL